MSSNPASKRDYKKEGKYEATPEQIARRVERNRARREYEKAHGPLPSNVDVDHTRPLSTGGTNNKENLRAIPESRNSAWRKGSTGYKVKKV